VEFNFSFLIKHREEAMPWKGRRESSDVEGRRGRPVKGLVSGGIETVIVILAIYYLGGDPSQVLKNLPFDNSQTALSREGTAEENELVQFVSVVPADSENF
jgi:predicted metalloprotease